MGAFIVRRLFGMILVLVAVSIIVYLIFIVIPGGNPAIRIAGRTATQANIKSIEIKLGLNHHGLFGFFRQWWDMVKALFTGSRWSRTPTRRTSCSRSRKAFRSTFSLAIGAGIIWMGFGIIVGTISAIKAGQISDRVITALALIGISLPVAWLGLLFRYFLAGEKGWPALFPDGGYVPLTTNPAQWFYHMILPWFTLAILFIGFYGRVLRSNILDTINEDFVRTAKAKGLSFGPHPQEARAASVADPDRDAVRPRLRSRARRRCDHHRGRLQHPGVGCVRSPVDPQQDLPPLMGVTLFGAMFIVVFTLIVDIAYAYLDPRIRLS